MLLEFTSSCCGSRGVGNPRPGRELTPSLAHAVFQGQFCDYCDAADPSKAHPVTNVIDGTERWWQSPPLSVGLEYNEVNVTLDLGQLFHIAYILIKFANSPRPDLWILERSVDFGRSYTPWQYFAHSKADCLERFGKEANVPVRRDDDVLCTTEYSRIVPLENGEIVISLVNGRPGAKNFTYSPTLREFTKATNIRLHFLRTNTLLGHLISKAQRDPTVTRRYYYSIKDISIGGRCVCHGHAEVCDAKSTENHYQFQCECQHNTCGETCNHCCPGYNQKQWQPATAGNTNICEPCNCYGHATDCYYDAGVDQRQESLNIHGRYEGGGVCINCQHNTAGVNCEKCAEGYYRPYGVPVSAPHGCIPCSCNLEHSEGCEEGSGRCYCKQNFQGESCEQCADGFYGFPSCVRILFTSPNPSDVVASDIIECSCDARGSVPNTCGHRGQCLCHSNYAGLRCDRCAPGYYSYPSCSPCECSPHGSHHGVCEPTVGQCECLTGFTGQQCDRCLSGGYCQCLQHVEGPTCNKCKPLYWNLAKINPEGCTACQCDVSGTLSGVGECQQENGHCYCKSNVCGDSCDTCEAGYYGLENKNYFGCQGCRCDVGGSLSSVCAEASGACPCREHVVGTTCRRPEKNYFFPDLHHMKFEVEDGTTVKGREIRFAYDREEFPGFSWRGYARMSSIQNEVRITLNVEKSNSFHIILRYVNSASAARSGRVAAFQSQPETGAAQSKEFFFPPSKEPAFVTIPGKSFIEPFSLVPGTWIVSIMAEEVLLDYMVLLPRDYYEASILQLQVTEPCTYSGHASTENCLLYQHLPLGRFSCVLGSEAAYFTNGGEHREMLLRQPTPDHPAMSHISGGEVSFQMTINVPHVGRYALVFEYANEEDQLYTAEVIINSPGSVTEGKVKIYSCKYSFLCRSVVVDDRNRIAVYDLLADTKILVKASSINFLLVSVLFLFFSFFFFFVMIFPREGKGRYILHLFTYSMVKLAKHTQLNIFPEKNTLPELFLFLQNWITLSGRVPHLGRYVFVVHFYQPAHPVFPVQVHVDAGHMWSGSFNASFCPHTSGCRDQVIAESQIELDVSAPEVSVTVVIPDGKMLILENILVVPADNYSYKILEKKTVDKSFDFISQCGGNSFYIDPKGSPAFCKDSIRSLVASYNNGAVPCKCHQAGATSPACSPLGGQCPCRPNVIGRRCSRCRTGYYGFPFCKLCNCGRRLCDEVTGRCICPPETLRPRCEVCKEHYFSYHPLAGCENCNCSHRGIVNMASPECDKNNGQCNCKPGIKGRRCDQCAPGTYGFPNCIPCNCNRGGTEPAVCDPQTGICLCKENVEGAKCDVCRPGSFYLDPSNPKGCTSCFCFGATNTCRSTNHRRTKFVDMRNWRLQTVNKNIDIPVTFNPVSNSVVADVQELPASVHSLYWKAPLSYLGEKLSSYGGYLSYQVKSFGLPSEGMALLDKRPDIELTGQQMKVAYVDPNNPLPDRQYYGRVQLVEGNFRHSSSNKLVSREELLVILSRLDGLHIRGLYFTETQRLTLAEVGLEEATSAGSGSIAYNVETCSCPPEYAGDSCQECGLGFYRENKGLFTGRCVPCNCNGNSNSCLDGSGKCINCQYNTAGEKCERCKDGYFGDATQGSCRTCPCPYTNSFATGCVANGEEIQCLCKEGYTGVRCERCAPGYFGNPQKYGGYCQKCNCNNNGQLVSCDHLTGECLNNEPKDVDPDEDCDSCDSCVITLLKDLSTIGDELQLIKSQLQNVRASSHTLEQMRGLETRIKDLKVLLDNYRSVVRNQGSKVDEMETDFINLNRDVNALQEKVTSFLSGSNTAVLAHVKNELQKYHQENHGLVRIVRDSLNEYESKLTDLREALNEASGQVKQAENLNRDNGVLLEDIKKRIDETNTQQSNILDILSSAQTSLTQASSVLGLLQKSKEEYESLAAQLDGARKDLNEKLTNGSLSASKEPLVVRAEEHANSLQALAKQLDEIKNSARQDGLVSCAVEASTAYDNIINAIKAAEEAANRAGSAADSALLVSPHEQPSDGKLFSANRWHVYIKLLRWIYCFAVIGPNLEDINRRVGVVDGQKDELKIDLVTLQNNLNGINRDDIDSKITEAKSMVKNAKDVTTSVLSELLPIQADVEEMKGTYGSTQSADFRKLLMEANSSVTILTNTLPDLFSKIESINQQLTPMNNISENVNRIRELIQQARDAANKIAIPMRFNGSSGVEVRPPRNLEDLRGYTSLSFFLQRPQKRSDILQRAPNMFVLYLGNKDASQNYLGMALKRGRLTCVYNLGGNEAEIDVEPLVTESNSEEAILDQVKLERIYQYMRLNYIKAATSTSPENEKPLDGNSGDSHTLLNLDPNNTVFYVGGYPPDFRPPQKLDYPHYEGCIELDSLNENIISLYNFKRTFNLNTTEVQPCRRYKEESDQSYFEGTGYASVSSKETNAYMTARYEQTIQTTADEGLVFFAANEDQFISILIKNGHPVFRYKIGTEPPKEIENNATVNDGTYKQQANEFFLSPALPETSFNISTPPFRGCMKNVKNPRTASVIFDETVGVSKKCSDDWKIVRSAAFSREGTLSLSSTGFPFPRDFQVSFGFRTVTSTGTLLNYMVRMGETENKLDKKYEDGSMHYVTVIKNDDILRLLVDDEPVSKTVGYSGRQPLAQPIRFGGDDFEGCISNVFIERYLLPAVQNLVDYTRKSGVALGACHQYLNPEPRLLQELNSSITFKMLKVCLFLQSPLLHIDTEAFYSAFSKWRELPWHFSEEQKGTAIYKIDLHLSVLSCPYRLHFSVDVRTRSSRGLVFFVEERFENSYLALHISKGRFVFSLVSGGKRFKIKTDAKYNDGQWHTVAFSRHGKSIRLVVDGLRAQHGRLGASSAAGIQPPIYLGGLPSPGPQIIPVNSFKGCLRNFKMNGEVMNTAQQKDGVLPCLDVPTETGIYFFNEGGYITIDHLALGLDFTIAFTVHPRSSAGVLLHSGSKRDNYLTVYMQGGKVSFTGSVPISGVLPTFSRGNSDLEYTNVATPWLPVRDPFIGCLRSIILNDNPVSPRGLSEARGAVSLHGCPAE
uniref:Laminin subunit alpha 3 n=1 Tax=Nothoprocta perdicaria TaxID=30464 RepID=A0A8C6ZTL4_NOTPE